MYERHSKYFFYKSTVHILILFSIASHYNLKKNKKKHAIFIVLKQNLTAGL